MAAMLAASILAAVSAQAGIDTANARFWDELCGSNLAREIGVSDASPASLERFDRAYLDLYPYLAGYLRAPETAGRRVLEIGLGNGRTYDHLRGLLPDRDIYVFDRQVAAHPDSIQSEGHLILGDVLETLPGLMRQLETRAALIHADIGSGDTSATAALAAALSTPQPPSFTRVGASVQARAFVRIVSAVTLRLGEGPLQGQAPLAQSTKVHTDGVQPARLIEFQ